MRFGPTPRSTPRLSLVAVLAILAAPPCLPAFGQQAPAPKGGDVPRVRLIATGGTISNRAGGRLTAEDLVESVPDLPRYARAEFEQFSNLPSSSVTLAQWLQLSRRVNEVLQQDRGLAGIVVTSGTDTLEELAYFLDLTVRDARPVVVVGSMRNPSTLGYEGAANLLGGFRVAAEPEARDKGVLVVLNDEINAAREVTKTDALRLQTFQSRSYGVLGVVDPDRVVFYRQSLKRHTAASEFDVTKITELPRVDVVLVYQDAPGDIITSAIEHGARGIVIAVAGAGATSGAQGQALNEAVRKGVIVVSSTRTGSGRVATRRTPQPATVIGAEDLTPVKARILLMLALAQTKDPAEIRRMFSQY